jgi:small-conductance mechanosensitive channel
MKLRQWSIVGFLLVMVLIAAVGVYVTGTSGPVTLVKRRAASPAAAQVPLVDQRPLQTARQLTPLASTPDEQDLSREALRLADHEVDLAFADALRDAKDHPAPLTPELRALAQHLDQSDAAVSADQAVVKGFTAAIAAAVARSDDVQEEALQRRLELAQAQLAVDEDELDDAKEDLIRAGGDPVSRIQRLLDEHEAAHQAAGTSTAAAVPPIDYQATSLVVQIRAANALRQTRSQLALAQQDALALAGTLGAKHDLIEKQVKQQSDEGRTVAHGAGGMASLDKRIRDEQDLAETYGAWIGVVESHQRVAVHGMTRSALWILLVVLVGYVAGRLVDRSLTGLTPEQRGRQTVRVAIRFAVQVAGAALILFVIFGAPNQTPTIVGLAGAGLTVALKDFIVAFLGWFVLMGRNGIRVGDWVEIKGVGGEVVEIGLLRTVLLETGTATESGHPTGRRATFVNSYAVEGHYFNFSTSGHWLWDEISIVVPPGDDPHAIIDGIQQIVAKETEANGRLAELEWLRATSRYKVKAFSAAPAIQVRPTTAGLEVLARYITRAHERHDVRARLYQQIVDLLHRKPAATA